MKTGMIVLFLLACECFGQVEVIKIVGDLEAKTVKYFWPYAVNGGLSIDENNIYISDENTVCIQSRNSKVHSRDEITVRGIDKFRIFSLLKTENKYYVNTFWGDGRHYLYAHNRTGSNNSGLTPKHGSTGRIFRYGDNQLLVSGNFRPYYSRALDLYDNNDPSGLSEHGQTMFEKFYLSSKSFTVSIYSDSLRLLDSLNIIDRTGENGNMFDRLWTEQAIDVVADGTIYLIDNDRGYVVEKYTSMQSNCVDMSIANKHFKPIPLELTEETLSTLINTPGSYSIAYALYVKEDMIFTSFYQNANVRDLPTPPFEYDIITVRGDLVASGRLSYPVVAEDDNDKIFIFVAQEGGWFDDDNLYLVGLTIEDIIAGRGEKGAVERAIRNYETLENNTR